MKDEFLGLHYRHINPTKRKELLKTLDNVVENSQTESDPVLLALLETEVVDDNGNFIKTIEILDDVILLVNPTEGKLGKILNPILKASNLKEKRKILEDNEDIINKANKANTNLRNYIVLKLNALKANPSNIYLMASASTNNIVKGFRALSTIEHLDLLMVYKLVAKNR